MPHLSSLLGFALLSLGMVLTPGPNMVYLISRSITQGHVAGLISLGGVALGVCVLHAVRGVRHHRAVVRRSLRL
jgi:threonine/homoserine/homoserine lactone efflux protein